MKYIFICFILIFACKQSNNSIYILDENAESRWISFENPTGAKSKGAMENNGAKGHPCDYIPAHKSIVLMDYTGTGLIQRIWLTINDRSAKMCRSLVINMYWDEHKKPAVSAPLGDFFGLGFEREKAFENELFTSGESRSFVSHLQMPFKSHAKIEIVNESDQALNMIFYDIDMQSLKSWDDHLLYLHGYWHRDSATELAHDFEILPPVQGKGKYIGTNICVIDNPIYGKAWWGEGEVKMYLDNDSKYPTIVGTGTEDYIGTAWGQGVFQNRYSGCLVGDTASRQWAFYRYHIPDPINFRLNCSVTLQQIGGDTRANVQNLLNKNLPLIPITIHHAPTFVHLYNPGQIYDLKNASLQEGWVNFYRSDDVAAMAYFYLNKPSNNLPPVQALEARINKL
ncbi:MAG: glycoside hydrolase family 172 protein [Saprospiraceae bacterium]